MMARKLTVAGALIALGVLALIAFAPTANAQAQEVSFQLSCSGGPDEIRPLSTPGSWSCTADPRVTTGPVSDPATFISIQLEPENEQSWMNTVIAPTSLVFEYVQGEGYEAQNFNVEVALTQNAPAFESNRLTIGGNVISEGAPAGRSVSVQPTDILVTPSYFNLYNVRLDTKIGQGGPQDSVDYNIQIDNFSNGDTRFEFNPANEEIPEGFQAVPPDPVVLQSEATGGERTTEQVTFSVYTPYRNGYVNEVGAIRLAISSAYATDTTYEGVGSTISTLTQARGFYVPGPGGALTGLAVVAATIGLAGADVVRKD